MRSTSDSPFAPGADTVPDVWAGRTRELSDWRDVLRPRRLSGEPERGRTILGEPGLGKSALVRRIAQEAQETGDWVTPQLRVALGADPIKLLAQALLDLAAQAGLPQRREARLQELLDRVAEVSVSGTSLTLRPSQGKEPHAALTQLLIEIGHEARFRGRRMIVVHLDEIQNVTSQDSLSQLFIALGDALAYQEEIAVPGGRRIMRSLPIAVYLTGLPEFEDLAGARHGATFARRFQTTTLAPISTDDLAAALAVFLDPGWPVLQDDGAPTVVSMEDDTRQAVVRLCCGEPSLFQLAGANAWYAGSSDVMTLDDVRRGWAAARDKAEAHVARILDRLPTKERAFIEAMAGRPKEDRTFSRIAEDAGYEKATAAGPVAQRLDRARKLISRGSPYTFKHRAVEAYLTTSWPDAEI